MMAIKQKTVFVIIAILLMNLVFMLYKKHELESSLSKKGERCVMRLQDMVELYESDLDNLQQEIDRRVLMQVNATPRPMLVRASEEHVSIGVNSKETLGEYSETIEEIISLKYHFLLKHLDIESVDLIKLKMLLKKRERIALKTMDGNECLSESAVINEDVRKAEELLSDLDIQIEQMLEPENQVRYAILKYSNVEQEKLNSTFSN
jgi:hypothetical protein